MKIQFKFVDKSLEVPQTLNDKFLENYFKKYSMKKEEICHLNSPYKMPASKTSSLTDLKSSKSRSPKQKSMETHCSQPYISADIKIANDINRKSINLLRKHTKINYRNSVLLRDHEKLYKRVNNNIIINKQPYKLSNQVNEATDMIITQNQFRAPK